MKTNNDRRARYGPFRHEKRLRVAAVLMTPPLTVFVVMFAWSLSDYRWTLQFDDWWSRMQTFQRVLGLKVLGMWHSPRATALKNEMSPDPSEAATINLDISAEEWDRNARDFTAGFDTFMSANVVRRKYFDPVRLRFRGDNSVHWLTEKRSLTLRARRSQLFKGYDRLAISSKDVLPQYITGRLAHQFDLIAPDVHISPVFVNFHYYGLYRILETLDESFLRRHRQIPGNIYRGDTAVRGEYYKGLERDLFRNPHIWDRVAYNDRPSAPRPDLIHAFVRDLNGQTFDDFQRFMSRFDRDELSRLVALMFVCGDMLHMSGIHNQYWYEDASSGQLHPIPWDLELQDLLRPAHSVNHALAAIMKDPRVLDGALRCVSELSRDDKILKHAERLARDAYQRFQPYFEYDELRRGAVNRLGNPDDEIAQLRMNIDAVRKWSQDARIAFNGSPTDDGVFVLDFESRGYAGQNLIEFIVDGPTGDAVTITLTADHNLNGEHDCNDRVVPVKWISTSNGGRLILTKVEPLLSGVNATEPLIRPAPIHYRYFVTIKTKSGDVPGTIRSIQPVLVNRVTGAPVSPIAARAGDALAVSAHWHPWLWPSPESKVVRLSGEVELSETLVVPPQDRLIIEPGTTVRLHPNVSIACYGRVEALADVHRPITFTSTEKLKPWGTFMLFGAATDGSRFEHCVFERGGGALVDRVECTGMVCAHWTRETVFRHCTFRDNLRCDDSLHCCKSHVEIDECRFDRANGDAIDLDMSTGWVSRCTISNSANDGIDLMTCNPMLVDNRIIHSGDKGISVGEGSHPTLFNNHIEQCNVGVEVKDGSEPLIIHNLLTNNRLGIRQRLKNWRYGHGGWSKLVNTLIVDSTSDTDFDNRSQLTMAGSRVGAWVDETSQPIDAVPMLAALGIDMDPASPGTVKKWRRAAVVPAVDSVAYHDDFADATGGWTGWQTMLKRESALVVDTRGEPVEIQRVVNWNLTNPNFEYKLLLEYAATSLNAVDIACVRGDGETRAAAVETTDSSQFRYVSMRLPRGIYKKMSIGLRPTSPTGHFFLHGFRLLALPLHSAASLATK